MSTKFLYGVNDLETRNPRLASEWHPTKNGEIFPRDIALNSNKKVWWLCSNGHEFEATPGNRVQGKGCPYCSGRRVLPGENDLLTKNPELAAEWDYEKNYPIRPEHIMPGRNKAAWWICKNCGHNWKAVINSRNRGSGCPKCAKRFQSSFPEQAVYYYVHQAYPDAINSYRDIFENQMELDIFIPTIKIGIEYDGERTHTERTFEKDSRKYSICREHGIRLIRIRETAYSGDIPICDIQIKSDYTTNYLTAVDLIIEHLERVLGFTVDHDTDRDRIKILEQIKSKLDTRSLSVEYPELSKEWNYERNGNLTPQMFYSGCGDRVWWRCSKGHEWKAAIHSRSKGSVGCPYCSNTKVLQGFNDLATTDPDIAMEWHPSKNGELLPQGVTRRTGKKVWWVCSEGHEYQMKVYHRTTGHKCPYCIGRSAISGENDFTIHHPELLDEWDYKKNEGMSPSDYLPGSEKKVWWICRHCGYSWSTIIANRVKGHGCPECGKQLGNSKALETKIQRYGSFESWCNEHPDKQYLLEEWDESNELKPSSVTPKSYNKIHWKCSTCGYRWTSEVFRRANMDKTCPVCLNRIALPGYNDLASQRPALLNEWCYKLNQNVSPETVTIGSSKTVWWQGKCGHKWEAKICDRSLKKHGCPYCSGARVLPGFNDLLTLNPKLAAQWDYERNSISPSEVTPGSHKKVFWHCENGHIWEAQIKSRNSGCGCPYCAGRHPKNSLDISF